jgi:hypothetical protein
MTDQPSTNTGTVSVRLREIGADEGVPFTTWPLDRIDELFLIVARRGIQTAAGEGHLITTGQIWVDGSSAYYELVYEVES